MSRIEEVSEFTEDASEQAGWMYADLFLALMVLFLATISFVPQFTKMPQTVQDAAAATVKVGPEFQRGQSQTYSTFDTAKIISDIHAFETAQKYPLNSEVLYAQIIGGYSQGQTEGDGNVTAIGFSLKLKAQIPEIFGKTNFSISADPKLPAGSVLIRLTLIPSTQLSK